MSPPVLGVLLAGGRGARLGAGGPKALATLAGRTLLSRAHAILAAVCDAVVVVAPAALALPVAPGERVDHPPGGA
ncbi:MAG TPA: NTP transferase domain-containing protein, partial [Candidatus Eisenbacteria bacterium]|nr:NTP transferase domain-containing protein [Candidatus Eisenbacteria bacterium]